MGSPCIEIRKYSSSSFFHAQVAALSMLASVLAVVYPLLPQVTGSETMEYERALFRVYDKSMEGFHSPGARSACNLLMKIFLVVSAGLFATLVLFHHQFVNNPGMLGL